MYINKRDLQYILDSNKYLDLTDEESALLIENLTNSTPTTNDNVHSNSSTDVYYPMLLLLLLEPLRNQHQVNNIGNNVYIPVRVYLCMYVCVFSCMYECMYVCMTLEYIYIHNHNDIYII